MDTTFPIWQVPYLDAIAEIPEESVRERIGLAERAILERLEALSKITGLETEKTAIREALDALHILKRNKLGFPNWGQAPVSWL